MEGGLSRFLHRKRNPVMIQKRTGALNNLTYCKNNKKFVGDGFNLDCVTTKDIKSLNYCSHVRC